METKVIWLVVLGTIGVMLMAFAVVFFVFLYKKRELENELEMKAIESKHQREMLSASLRSQEAERNRLGSELHDSVGAMLSSIKMNLQVSKRNQQVENLDPVLGYLDETINQVRAISHEMMPIVFKKYGLKKAVEDLFKTISTTEINAGITHWTDIPLDNEDALMLFRIIQELTQNTLKHAKASAIDLRVAATKISYRDNGVGFPKEILSEAAGMGLLNIVTRAQALGCQVHFSNQKSGGAIVDLVFDSSID